MTQDTTPVLRERPAIRLRFPALPDTPGLVAAVQESYSDLSRWMDWARPDYSPEQAAQWIGQQSEERENATSFTFVIVDEGGSIVGTCGINQINAVHRFANVGYWIRSSMAGRGLAAAAVEELCLWAFEHTSLQRLEILVAIGNRRSERVAEKVGAHREGILRSRLLVHGEYQDVTVYSILRTDGPFGAVNED